MLILAGLLLAPAARAQPAPGSTLARIKATGVLRWGADPSGGAPFVFTDPTDPDKVVGFEVEIVAALARHMGVRAELVPGDWNALIPSLQGKRIDLAVNGLEVNAERASQVSFTYPYFLYAQQLTVRSADKQRYHSLEDLKGKPIAVLNGSQSVSVLKENGWPDNLIKQYDDSLKPYDDLKARRVEAALAESIIADYYAGKDNELFNVSRTFAPGMYAAAVRDGDSELLVELNRILHQMRTNGELGEIYQKWGVWSKQQESLGIVKGKKEAASSLARPDPEPSAGGWSTNLPALLRGAGYTLLLTCLSMPLALLFGLALALMGRSRRWWIRLPASVYVQIIRGTPLLVQIYVIYFSLPILGKLLDLGDLLTWPALAVGVLCLSANYAAYEAEIHRAGLDAVPKGQREAALSLGMSENQAFVWVILPQSFRIILPPVVNDLVSMLKDSCLVSVMGVGELLYVASSVGKATFRYGEMLIAAAAIYLVLSWAASSFGAWLERYLRQRGVPHVEASEASH